MVKLPAGSWCTVARRQLLAWYLSSRSLLDSVTKVARGVGRAHSTWLPVVAVCVHACRIIQNFENLQLNFEIINCSLVRAAGPRGSPTARLAGSRAGAYAR
jgi:hypothetical protein